MYGFILHQHYSSFGCCLDLCHVSKLHPMKSHVDVNKSIHDSIYICTNAWILSVVRRHFQKSFPSSAIACLPSVTPLSPPSALQGISLGPAGRTQLWSQRCGSCSPLCPSSSSSLVWCCFISTPSMRSGAARSNRNYRKQSEFPSCW